MRKSTSFLKGVTKTILTGVAFFSLQTLFSTSAFADLMITDVTIIDPKVGTLEHQDVLIAGETIAAVSETGSIAIFAPVETLDGSGKFLIPALWDAHVHLTFDPEIGDAALPLFVANGVTRVRDTGGKLDLVLAVRERAAALGTAAPAIYFAGPLIDGYPRVYDGTPSRFPDISEGVRTREDAFAEVDRLAAAGVHLIKTYEMLKPDVFQALLERAAFHKLPVTSHVPLSMQVEAVAASGVRGMEHLRNIGLSCSKEADLLQEERTSMLEHGSNEEGSTLRASIHASQRPRAFSSQDPERCATVITALATNRVFQTPTLALNTRGAFRQFLEPVWRDPVRHLPPKARTRWNAAADKAGSTAVDPAYAAFAEWSLSMVARLHEAGVPIMAGTDTPIGLLTPGFSLHLEMEMLVRAGLSPMDALAAATVRPAEFFGRENEMGTLEAGKSAELVLLNANPLDDIRNTRNINAVVTRGELLDRATLDDMLSEPEE